MAVLDPDVVLRAHRRDGDPIEVYGAARVARGAMTARQFAPYIRPALVKAPPVWPRSTASGRSRCLRSRSSATAPWRSTCSTTPSWSPSSTSTDHRLTGTPPRPRGRQRCRRRLSATTQKPNECLHADSAPTRSASRRRCRSASATRRRPNRPRRRATGPRKDRQPGRACRVGDTGEGLVRRHRAPRLPRVCRWPSVSCATNATSVTDPRAHAQACVEGVPERRYKGVSAAKARGRRLAARAMLRKRAPHLEADVSLGQDPREDALVDGVGTLDV